MRREPLSKIMRAWLAVSIIILILGSALTVLLLNESYRYPYDASNPPNNLSEEKWEEVLTIPKYRMVLMTNRQLAQAVADIPILSYYAYSVGLGVYSAEEFEEGIRDASNALRTLIHRGGGGKALYQVMKELANEAINPAEIARVNALRTILYYEKYFWEELTEEEQRDILNRLPEEAKK